ncbi:MAG: TIGR02444 family protein [Janthinobacterium lividum]|uniref:TIGR02444 family protein n=1 Tax=Pseudomonas sp. MWU16-30317 TaxID=2878095 RepID=UPI001CF95D7A|nr:TIGR02444 family protein [Pseudomonas sp. MWU16-30317]
MQADLWTFAVSLYQCPGVTEDCLALQDDLGANVCLLLCGAWLERRSVACTPERLAMLETLAQEWSAAVVEPLRGLRRRWREVARHDSQLAQLRETVKGLELQAEKILLERLARLCEDWPATAQPKSWLEALLPEPKSPAAKMDDRGALGRLRAAVPDA